jgi:iron complex outermembrane recepter protein
MGVLPFIGLLALSLVGADQDLTSLSLEEFLNVEVTSVRRARQKLSRTAAAVFVITRDDIRRSGAASLPEVMRLAPGVHVARISTGNWAIGIRGFTSLYSNKLLVMVDGRTLYHPLVSGVLWIENLITLEDIERIEVIRGTGATVWGSNAVSGVINIITKRASASQGGMVKGTSGNVDPARVQARYGGRMPGNGHWRVSSSANQMGQLDFPMQRARLPQVTTAQGGTRLDWDRGPRNEFTVASGMHYNNTPIAQILVDPSGRPGVTKLVGGARNAFLTGRWTHTDAKGNSGSLQIAYDGRYTDGGTFGSNLDTFDFDYQQGLLLPGGHQIMAGGGFRSNRLRTSPSAAFGFDPASRTYNIYNLMLQDEWQILPDQLYFTAGVKVERNWGTGVAAQPTIRLLWAPTARLVAWGSWSHAMRTPSHVDFALRYPLQIPESPLPIELTGNAGLNSEWIHAADAGLRWQATRRFAIDLAVFHHSYHDLMAYEIGPIPNVRQFSGGTSLVLPARTVNARDGVNQGGEFVAYYELTPRWQISGTYSFLSTQLRNSDAFERALLFSIDSYDPRHQGYIRSSMDLPRRWSADITLYRRGSIRTGLGLPAANRLDLRVARSFGENNEISFSAQNLGRAGQFEAPLDLLAPRSLIRRSFEVSLTHRF